MRPEPDYRADGRDCSEQQFYALACDPHRSAVVEACAGAGKTWMLVSRVLRALLDGAAPSQILAITFTRKAASEMRARLHDWLREWAEADAAQRLQALRARGLSAEEAQRLEPALAGLHARVLVSGEAVQMHTFHAWFAQMLRMAPLELLDELGLQPAMTLIEEIDDQLGELLRRLQRQVLDDPVLLDDYRSLTERHGRSRLERWLRAVIDKRIEIERADRARTLQRSVEAAAQCWPECAGLPHPLQRMLDDTSLRRVLGAAVEAVRGNERKTARDAGDALGVALDRSDAEAAYAAARQALFTKDGRPRALGDSSALAAAVAALTLLQEQAAQQDAHDDHQRMLRLARPLLAQWSALKRERALVDMPDLERCALALLSDPTASGWVQQRLDVQLRHVLIDEFQDTSVLQWLALQGWLSSYAGAGGGASGQRPPTVFIVGDPKQSIYRFRGAEPRVFDAARRFIIEGLQGHDLGCDHTRRNRSGVLDAINAVFTQAQSAGEFDAFRAHSTACGDEPGSAWHLPDPPEAIAPERAAQAVSASGWRDSLTVARTSAVEPRAQAEARDVARAVQWALRHADVRPADVMVLARRHTALARVAEALRALHVPCVATEALRLADLVEVRDLVAVLDVLASPANDLSLAQALKSPLFGASDAQLLALSQRVQRGAATPWWSALMQWHDAPAALARARMWLARWADDAQRLPPHDLLDRIVGQGELLPRLAAAAPPERRGLALAAVDALLGLSLALDGGRHASVYRFVRALRQRMVSVRAPLREDAVQLLSIHGAKGLEARWVFVVDADPNPPRESDPGVLVDWPLDRDAPQRVAFVADLAQPCQSLLPLRAAERAAAGREELNALYVAMTRAQEVLVFSRTPARKAAPEPSWWSRAQPHTQPWPEPRRAAADAAVDASRAITVVDLPRVGHANADLSPPAASTSSPAARLGQTVHRVLQWATASGDPAIDYDALAAAAAAEFELAASAVGVAARMARTVRASAALRRFFDPAAVLWSADEFDLRHEGQWLRIDRLVRLGPAASPSWWVLDYKLALDAADDPALRAQLGRYRDAVQQLAGIDPVHAAFVTADGSLQELDESV
jgi:ATP-dependent helicase/nuclease subunit A